MKTLRLLDSSGDRMIMFDDGAKWDTARAEAKAMFERALAGGAVAFKVNRGAGSADEPVRDFAALDNETILVPRVTGG